MTSLMPSNLLLKEHGEVRLRVEPTGPRGNTGPGSPGTLHGRDTAHPGEGAAAFTALTPHRPRIRRVASADPAVSLGPLGWLAVLLAAVLLSVLAHAGSVRSGQRAHPEPSQATVEVAEVPAPGYVLADPADPATG